MANFKSQCVVRLEEELAKNKEVADSISLLSYIDEELKTISDIVYARLYNADLIRYDISLIGGPIVSKRERNLLNAISKEFSPEPNIKLKENKKNKTKRKEH